MGKATDMTNPAIVLEGFKSADSNSYDAGKLRRSITDIKGAGKKLDARIHATATGLLYRSADHNDCSLVPSLIEAMPRSARRKALVAWFHAYSNVRINETAEGVTANMIGHTSKMWREPQPAEAFAKPFWSVEEKDTDPREFKLGSRLASIIKAAEAASLTGSDAEALADLKVIAAKLEPVA